MKKLILFFVAALALSSCSNQGTASKETMKDSATVPASGTVMNYPYTIDHPDNWEMGSTANTMVALSALKAFEMGNVAESMKYFGDSIHLQFDGLDKTMSSDSVKAMFT